MWKYLRLVALATVIFAGASLLAHRTEAMTIGTPAGALAAAAEANLTENVVWVCRWRHGRRVCWWRPGPRYYRYYGYYGPYAPPYWRWHRPYYRPWWW